MQINFIEEMNAFFRWNRTNYLPPASQLLWYKLFMLFNEAGWSEWVEATNQELMALIRYSNETTFISIRDNLIEKGLLVYKKGKKGAPNKYKMLFLTAKNGVQTEVYPGVETGVQTGVYSGVETGDIYKLNETKLNENNIPSISPSGEKGKGEGKTPNPKNKNHEPKRKLGEYKHVRLTDKQIERLKAEWGEETFLAYVKRADEYCQQMGKTYDDYNLTIRKWKRRDDEEAKKKHGQVAGVSPKAVPKYGHSI